VAPASWCVDCDGTGTPDDAPDVGTAPSPPTDPTPVPALHGEHDQLRRILDQPDPGEQPRRRAQQVRLEHRCAEHP
jgi:hypothetical protein